MLVAEGRRRLKEVTLSTLFHCTEDKFYFNKMSRTKFILIKQSRNAEISYFLKAQILFQFIYLKAYKTVQKKS